MTQRVDHEIVVIGAGAAGLAAARQLHDAGLQPLVLEARERIGGRILTDHSRAPVECGAEFIHGEHAATWATVRAAGIATHQWGLSRRFAQNGTLLADDDTLSGRVNSLYEAVEHYTGPEKSAADVIAEHAGPDAIAASYARRWLANFEGADVDRLSAQTLGQERRLNTAGWQNFCFDDGYDSVPQALATGLAIRLGTAVTKIRWDDNGAVLTLSDNSDLTARRVIITVPITLLAADRMAFDPPLPPEKQNALQAIAMGHVTKLVLWFDQPIAPTLGIISTNDTVSTWWPVTSRNSAQQPALMGYTGGKPALSLAAMGEREAIACGIDEVAALFGKGVREHFVAGRMIAWSDDPWSLGAYTYSPVNIGTARADLAAPLAQTLFFAGEATNTHGHLATVHGAIETGWRAASEVANAH